MSRLNNATKKLEATKIRAQELQIENDKLKSENAKLKIEVQQLNKHLDHIRTAVNTRAIPF